MDMGMQQFSPQMNPQMEQGLYSHFEPMGMASQFEPE